ncbi:MAG: hypothetical protein PHY16_11645 [Methylobacter sp.]|nr:hypothetical protein [Methylobacter sp.]
MKKKQMPVSGMIADSLEKQALAQLNSGKYKEAIELYKKLLQDSGNSEWRQQLAYCYLQRALTFAAKGMYKEALVLWENYSQQAQPPYEAYDHYISWLIQTKNQARIQSCLDQLSARQLDNQYPALAALLGALIITDHPEFQKALPQDSAFIKHVEIAKTALQAYQENDPDGVEEALKELPYRSAFRDFRALLKAAVTAPASVTEAQSLLAKIPANSPYSQAARLLQVCFQKGSALAWEMVKLNHQQRRLIGEITGLNKKQLDLIESLSSQKDRLSDKIKFNLAIQYQSLWDSGSAQRFCFAMLASYPAGQRDFNKHFGAIDEFEENRLKALLHERDNNSYEAEYYWKQCVKILTRQETGNGVKTALILRHIAEKQPEPSEQVKLLIESLEHDPEDRGSYLQILRYYGQQQETADDFKQWLTKTLEKFPQDIDVLTLALQAAMRGKTYKKAGQLALSILKIDPLNTATKQILFSSHLMHAHQLLKGKKYHLVENEIKQAEDLKIGKNYTIQTQLMRGLFYFAAQDKKPGLQLIVESLNRLNSDPVNAHFQAIMETFLAGLPVAAILRELPPAKEHLLSAKELTRFIELLKQYNQESGDEEYLRKALEKVKSALKKSVHQQDYDESLLLTLCETLGAIHHFELLRHCAKWAQAKWQKPIWMYYRIYSETNGIPEKCSYMQCFRLEDSLVRARREKDHRSEVLIGNYLDGYHEAHPGSGLGFLANLFDENEEDNYDDPFDQLFGHLPDEIFIKLNKKIVALAKKISPERLIQELAKELGQDSKILNAIMQDPDLFTALMILKAANDLGINIEVSVADVLACFGVGKKTSPFPF